MDTKLVHIVLSETEQNEIFYQYVSYIASSIGREEHLNLWLYKFDKIYNQNCAMQDSNYRTEAYASPYRKLRSAQTNNTFEFQGKRYTPLKLFETLNNYTWVEAAEKFAQRLGFTRKNITGELAWITQPSIVIPENSELNTNFPLTFSIRQSEYRAISGIPIRSKNGYKLGEITVFSNGEEYFLLPATFVEGESFNTPHSLAIGRHTQKIALINENLLNFPSKSIVIFCMSVITAEIVKNYIENENVVVTASSCEYGSIKEIDFSALYGKSIIFLPEPTPESFLNVLEYKKQLRTKEDKEDSKLTLVSEICFCNQPVIYLPKQNSPYSESSPNPTERHLALFYNNEEKFSLENLNKNVSHDDYLRWLVEIGLKQPTGYNEKNANWAITPDLNSVDEKITQRDVNFSLEGMFPPNNIAAIIGDSDAGKGMFAYSLALAFSCHFDIFGMKSNAGHKILYLDAETSSGDSLIKIERIRQAYKGDKNNFDRNFYIVPLEQIQNQESLDLLNPKFQDQIFHELSRLKPELFFIDNLLTLGGGAHRSGAKASELIDFFRQVTKQYHTAVVYCHHTGKNGDPLGSSELESITQNIFILTGQRNLKNRDRSLPYAEYLSKPGCTFELYVKKCKSYPSLNEKRYVWHLSYNEKEPTTGGVWEEIFDGKTVNVEKKSEGTISKEGTSIQEPNADIQSQENMLFYNLTGRKAELPKNDQKLKPENKDDLVLMFAIRRNLEGVDKKWFTTGEATKALHLKNNDFRNVRDRLLEKNLLNQQGENAASRYCLKMPSDEK